MNKSPLTIPQSSPLTPRRVFDSGANRHIFNHKSWIMDANSPPLTPTITSIHGISGAIQVSYHCIIGNYDTVICPTAEDNVMSIGRLSQFPSIITTFRSVDNTFQVTIVS